MNRYIFAFDDLTPYPKHNMYVSGFAELNWQNYPAEPDVGIMRKGISFDVEEIHIESQKFGGQTISLSRDSELFKLIEKELFEKYDHLIQHQILNSEDD